MLSSEPTPWRDELRESVRFFYDLQKLRIQTGLRAGNDKAVLSEIAVKRQSDRSGALSTLEKTELKAINKLIQAHPLYPWLKAQKGCGPTMSGVILSEIDITRCGTISALWAYCGLSVGHDGTAPKRRKGCTKKDGTPGLAYNSMLRSKLVGVLADCMIKCNSPWREHYDNRKTRTRSKDWGKSDGHRNNDAKRVMIKRFLQEMWKEWRTLEGLPVPPPYSETYLGLHHGDHGQRKKDTHIVQASQQNQDAHQSPASQLKPVTQNT